MTALTFTLKKTPSFKINCGQLTPNLLQGLTCDQIALLPLSTNKHALKVGDIFEVSGTDTDQLIFKNSTSQLDYIGYKMSRGSITIQGDAGDFTGCQMQNGTLICQGNVGDRTGDQMRRGMLLIDGNAGDYCASRMVAGTIGVYGNVGQLLGFGMKRGTILLTQPPPLIPTIQDCGSHTLPFLALLYQAFKPLASKFSTLNQLRVQRFAGDLASNGRGEILVISTS